MWKAESFWLSWWITPKYLIVIVSHSEDLLSEGRALSHALEKVNRGYASTTKGGRVRRGHSLGQGALRLTSLFPLSDGANNAFPGTQWGPVAMKVKAHSDLIKLGDDSQVFTVKSSYIACLIFSTSPNKLITWVISSTYEIRKLRLREVNIASPWSPTWWAAGPGL